MVWFWIVVKTSALNCIDIYILQDKSFYPLWLTNTSAVMVDSNCPIVSGVDPGSVEYCDRIVGLTRNDSIFCTYHVCVYILRAEQRQWPLGLLQFWAITMLGFWISYMLYVSRHHNALYLVNLSMSFANFNVYQANIVLTTIIYPTLLHILNIVVNTEKWDLWFN